MELLIAFVIFGAVTAAAWALIVARTDAHLATQARLERVAGRLAADWNTPVAPALRSSRLSNIAWIESLLKELDLARAVDLQLIRADWNLRVAEFLALVGVSAAIAFLGGVLIFHLLPVALVLAIAGGYIPLFVLKRAVMARRRKIEKQLVEALGMIANSLRAGFGMRQALDQAARQLQDPIAKELRQTIRDTQVGSSIEESVSGLGIRVGSYDLEIVVTAILIQRSVGGNLAEILDGVAHTMRERERIRGEINTLTAQQRLTGFIIAALPPALTALFYVMNPDYMGLLFTTTPGRVMVTIALVLEVIGAWIIKKIVSIEV